MKCKQNTDRTQTRYNETQMKRKQNTDRTQTRYNETKINTDEIQMEYKINTEVRYDLHS